MNTHPLESPVADKPLVVDFTVVAKEVKLSPEILTRTVALLDEGHTIPFITRFRKDLTGGLNERQILDIKRAVAIHRALAERKTFVIKSIESQNHLTDELKTQILSAPNSRALEDIYLPFKPQKQSRAAVAKQQGLEPLVEDIVNAADSDVDLATRATQFVRVDKGLNSVDDVIRGVTDLLIDRFSEHRELRDRLRQIVRQTGALVSKSTGEPSVNETQDAPDSEPVTTPATTAVVSVDEPPKTEAALVSEVESAPDTLASGQVEEATETVEPLAASDSESLENIEPKVELKVEPETAAEISKAQDTSGDSQGDHAIESEPSSAESDTGTASKSDIESPAESSAEAVEAPLAKKTKKKKKKSAPDPFRDYADFKQPLKNLSHHQLLAINRGERSGKLKVKIQADDEQLHTAARESLVPADHPFAEFLGKCATECVSRTLFPSIEREARRELTEAAERHATDVFANNLRNLLLQPPMRNCRVLAIDPGFKSGCAVAILDPLGNVIDQGQVYVVGNQSKRDESKKRIADWVHQHAIDVIAIGTGVACRQAEQLVSDTIAESLTDSKVHYVMVNEAGASVYSTSETGREELPELSPAIRSAVSIGRRLQDPLSELVKISPANIGVGMYQHDVKAKHLVESLDEVVEFCVNQVGVNANTASVSLLKYVSGLNALTARRFVEHRQKVSGFRNRQQFREVSGIGEATFVQAAGFLRIHDGDNPLDSTSIHPESYSLAEKVIEKVGATSSELFPRTQEGVAVATEAAVTEPEPQQEASPTADADQVPETAPPESTPAELTSPEPTPTESVESASEVSAESAPPESGNAPVLTEVSSAAKAPPETFVTQLVAVTREQEELRGQVVHRLNGLDIGTLAQEYGVGRLLVKDILLTLKKPSWDPRDRAAKPIFRRGILKIDDLKPEMQLEGQIVNVVDFGVFIDIGLGESSLVHVSQLAHSYVADPNRLFSVGNIMKVWVAEVDSARRRVKLTAIEPGSKPPQKRSRQPFKKHGQRTEGRKEGEPRTSKPSDRSESQDQTQTPREKVGRFGHRAASSGPGKDRFDQRKPKPRFEKSSHREKNSRPRVFKSNMPAPPITDEMLKGNEPMRSFSDLLQFVQKKPKDEK